MAKGSGGTRANRPSRRGDLISGGERFHNSMRKDELGLLYEQRDGNLSNKEERSALQEEGFSYINLGIRGEYTGMRLDDKHAAVLNEVGRQQDGSMIYNVIPMYHWRDIPEGENWVKGSWSNGSKLHDVERSVKLSQIPSIIAQWRKQLKK